MLRTRRFLLLSALTTLALAGSVSSVIAKGFERQYTFTAERFRLANLIGEIDLEPASGSSFEVEIDVQGNDASEDLIEIELEEGGDAELVIRFPVKEHRRYVYPALGRRSKTTIDSRHYKQTDDSLSGLLGLFGRRRIEVRGRGKGLEMWADVVLRVPQGAKVKVYHGVGEILAGGIEADLELYTRSGGVTGEDLKGNLLVDTGSGGVELVGCRGEVILVDTGSGGVAVSDIECEELTVDTGSGGVRARHVSAEDVKIDTGSGGVKLELDRMGAGTYEIDTGSGGIDLFLPPDPSARISADTGSGSITADLDGLRLRRRKDTSFKVGDGDAVIVLDTGSGSIRISN